MRQSSQPIACPVSAAPVARFAPSPTGISHAGNIFAYLVTWLMSRSLGGSIVLRIEDLDASRSKKAYVDHLLNMLDELGLSYDSGPYFQSDNAKSYSKAFDLLENKGLIYPCFCTRAELSYQSAPHSTDGIRIYDRRCLKLSNAEIQKKTEELESLGRRPARRLKTDSRKIKIDDVFQGTRESVLDADCGDFIIKRADSDFAYNLAVVLDDISQGVNFVSRGCDLLNCTPQQIYIYELLGRDLPTYAHFPLICAQDGRRLAKRDADMTYDSLKDSLGSPERVLGHISYLTGLVDKDTSLSPAQLLEELDYGLIIERLSGREKILIEGSRSL